MKKNLKIQKM